MIKFLKKYYMAIICIFITIIYTFMGKLVDLGVKSQIVTMIIYIPLIIAFILFCIRFVKNFSMNRKLFIRTNLPKMIFIIFTIYCIYLFIYRFIMGLEYMEGFHFASRIIGAIALYFVVVDSSTSDDTMKNLLIFTAFIDTFLIFDFIFINSFRDTNILSNVLIDCCIILTLGLVCIKYFKNVNINNRLYDLVCEVHFFILIVTTMLSGSRTMFVLGAILVVYTIICVSKYKKYVISYLVVSVCSIITLLLLYNFNIGDAVFTIDKQMLFVAPNIYSKVIENQNVGKENDNIINSDNNINDEKKVEEDKNIESLKQIETQIDESNLNQSEEITNERIDSIKSLESNSDYMRGVLRKKGIEEVKKNVLFGTGNVYFDYMLGERKLEQTAHNFIIETLISFGLIGTLMLAFIIIAIIFKILSSRFISINDKIGLLLMCGIVGAFSLYQQMLYNYIVLPVVFFIIAMYQTSTLKRNNN